VGSIQRLDLAFLVEGDDQGVADPRIEAADILYLLGELRIVRAFYGSDAIQFMAVESVREGEAPSAVIASYGFSRTTIYEWLVGAGLQTGG
jgi:hypothetical protein